MKILEGASAHCDPHPYNFSVSSHQHRRELCPPLPQVWKPGRRHKLLGTLGKESIVLSTAIPNPPCMKLSLKCALNPQTFALIRYEAKRGPRKLPAQPGAEEPTWQQQSELQLAGFPQENAHGGVWEPQDGKRLMCIRGLCNLTCAARPSN